MSSVETRRFINKHLREYIQSLFDVENEKLISFLEDDARNIDKIEQIAQNFYTQTYDKRNKLNGNNLKAQSLKKEVEKLMEFEGVVRKVLGDARGKGA